MPTEDLIGKSNPTINIKNKLGKRLTLPWDQRKMSQFITFMAIWHVKKTLKIGREINE